MEEKSNVVSLATFRESGGISLAEENDSLRRENDELKKEIGILTETLEEANKKDEEKPPREYFWSSWFLSYRANRTKRRIEKVLSLIERRKKIEEERRDEVVKFLISAKEQLAKVCEDVDVVILYEPVKLDYRKSSGRFYALLTDGKTGWNNNELVDTLIEQGIDLDEFVQTVRKNLLIFLESKTKE